MKCYTWQRRSVKRLRKKVTPRCLTKSSTVIRNFSKVTTLRKCWRGKMVLNKQRNRPDYRLTCHFSKKQDLSHCSTISTRTKQGNTIWKKRRKLWTISKSSWEQESRRTLTNWLVRWDLLAELVRCKVRLTHFRSKNSNLALLPLYLWNKRTS